MGTRTDSIQLRVFLEGIRIKDIVSVQVTSTNGPDSDATIVIPDTRFFHAEKIPRARLHVFWSDLEIRANDSDGSKGTWPILFEGELWGDEKYKAISERSLSVRFRGYSEYWKQTLLFYLDAATSFSGLLGAIPTKLALGTQIKLLAGTIGEHTLGLPELLEKLKREKKPEHITMLIITRLMQRALESNSFYRSMNNRLKLSSRLVSVPDFDITQLVELAVVVDLFKSGLEDGTLSGKTSILELFSVYFSYLRYHMLHIPTPKFATSSGDIAVEFGNLRRIIQAAREGATLETPIQVSTLLEELAEAEAQENQEEITRIETELSRLNLAFADVEQIDFGENTGFLGQFLALPETAFMQPPVCNVIFPHHQTGLGLSRNFMDEPTKLVLTTRPIQGVDVPLIFATPPNMSEDSDTGVFGLDVVPVEVPANQASPSTTPEQTTQLGDLKIRSPLGGTPSSLTVSHGFGESRGSRFHKGWDIGAQRYAPVYAIADGTVESIRKDRLTPGSPTHAESDCAYPSPGPAEKWQLDSNNPGGNYVKIRHDVAATQALRLKNRNVSAFHSWYMHLSGISKFALDSGSSIRKDQIIGWVGDSGRADGPHLHLQLTFANNDNLFINPTILFPKANIPSSAHNAKPTDLDVLRRDQSPSDSPEVRRAIENATLSGTSSRFAGSQPDSSTEGVLLQRLLTPEERRRGINAAFLETNDVALLTRLNQNLRDAENDATKLENASNERTTFMLGFIEHLFLQAKYATRQIPALTSPFNPSIVAGFPTLIVDPIRSILGQVEAVSHNIDNRGNATTVVQISNPRYWNEGDIWYWQGGWSGGERTDLQKFPPWYNHKFIATNNLILDATKRIKNRIPTNLDMTYQVLLGCNAIDYVSVNADHLENPFVDPATGMVLDYNNAIDGRRIDDSGKEKERLPYTIISSYYGQSELATREDDSASRRQTRRLGIQEKELMEEFLKATKGLEKGIEVYRGKAFENALGSDEKAKAFYQNHILDYAVDLQEKTARRG